MPERWTSLSNRAAISTARDVVILEWLRKGETRPFYDWILCCHRSSQEVLEAVAYMIFRADSSKFDPAKTSEIRIPLDHPETETLGRRIHNLIWAGVLNEHECGFLIKNERELRKMDRRLARVFLGAPLPETGCRPNYPDEWQLPQSVYWGLEPEIVQTG